MALKDLLGQDSAGVVYGTPTLDMALSAYVTAGGAGTFFSAGYTFGGISLEGAIEVTKIIADQLLSPVAAWSTGQEFGFDAELLQNNLQNMRVALGLESNALTGAANGALLVFNDVIDEFFQVRLKAPGPGTGTTHAGTKLDTYLFWKCLVRLRGPIKFEKKGPQTIPVRVTILPDTSVQSTPGTPEFVKGLYGNRVPA